MTAAPIFSRQQYDALKAAQRQLHDMLPSVDKGEACGFDCQAYRQAHADFAKQLEQIEQQFFPHPPG